MTMQFRNIEQIFKVLGIKVKKEYRFHPKRRWRFDYAIPDRKIAFEYEGVFRCKSRHTTLEGYSKDCEKYNEAALMGWTVLRFTAVHLRDGTALEQIERAVR